MNLTRLPRAFYERDTLVVARELLGKALVRRLDGRTLVGRIVETEAYKGRQDPASHAYRGKTARNAPMFSHGGISYLFLAYGSSFCLNASTEAIGVPGAVLIRAVEPLLGIQWMRSNRTLSSDRLEHLTNGPGKLCQAMRITGELNGIDLTQDGPLSICRLDGGSPSPFETKATSRVGLTKAYRRRWRFYIEGNKFVSRT